MDSVKNNLLNPQNRQISGTREDQKVDPKHRDPKMLEAAQSFENQFVRQMISEMRKTVPKDELIPESMGENIFRDQLDDQYADQWVGQGGIGLTDLIYEQLDQRYGKHVQEFRKPSGQEIPLPPSHLVKSAPPSLPGQVTAMGPADSEAMAPTIRGRTPTSAPMNAPMERPQDIFSRMDKNLFLAKKTPNGFDLKSREPLPEKVGLRAPLSGVVLQAASLPDGRQMVVLKHDQGLVSQFVHSGYNRVKTNSQVHSGDVIADLPPSQNGEAAHVFFGLRKQAPNE